MSCSLGQILHLRRAHRPPNSALMRKLVQTQVVDQKRTAGTGMNNPRATRREIWCCLAQIKNCKKIEKIGHKKTKKADHKKKLEWTNKKMINRKNEEKKWERGKNMAQTFENDELIDMKKWQNLQKQLLKTRKNIKKLAWQFAKERKKVIKLWGRGH